MNNAHRKTLAAIFARPTKADIRWSDIEALIKTLGGVVEERDAMTMEYKGYTAGPLDFDPEDGTFSGTVAGLSDIIHFEGSNAAEVLQSFRDGIDEYLLICQEKGRTPDRPFSGKMLIRATPELHRKAALRAAAEGVSISQWVSKQIDAAP